MYRQTALRFFLLGISAAFFVCLFSSAEAQILRRFRDRGPLLRAPLVRVQSDPNGNTSVRAPLVAVDPGGARIGLRRRLAPLPVYAIPARQRQRQQASQTDPSTTAQDEAGQVEQAAHLAEESLPVPSLEELESMENSQLIVTLADLTDQLDQRLAQISTGAGWQHYLQLPEEALHDPTANLDTMLDILGRFDSVADNPEYAMIAGLPSFIATKAALRQAIARLDGPRIVDPNDRAPITPTDKPKTEEILPVPEPAVEPEPASGEHSILKPAS